MILISEETAQRVRDVANQLGYSPHPIARALRRQPIGLIGLVVREIADPFFAEVIETLSVLVREQELISKTTLGKLATPRDQGNAALFLASDLASHITGEYLVVSGGEFMNA
jgi:NAD(P)-dependent dehydrogenase (short-subunit alcohol dehydrogenase family)